MPPENSEPRVMEEIVFIHKSSKGTASQRVVRGNKQVLKGMLLEHDFEEQEQQKYEELDKAADSQYPREFFWL